MPEGEVRFKAREQRLVTFDVHVGALFTKADAKASDERDIVITATADGAAIGGMAPHIDPELDMPYNDRTPEEKKEQCNDKARELLECLDLPSENIKRVHVHSRN